jgi:hypothetical protein
LEHRHFISLAWFSHPEPCKEEVKIMKTTRFSGLVCVALTMFALPAAAQAPGQTTPATTGLCDELADKTPGLQGLCVAMCEAQACEPEINPVTGDVEFGPSCGPSAPQLLENYNEIVKRNEEKAAAEDRVDPPMPCVKVTCPCWDQAELEDIGGIGYDVCNGVIGDVIGDVTNWVDFRSTVAVEGVREYATASYGECSSNEAGFSGSRYEKDMSTDAYGACLKTVADECSARGLLP